MCEHTHRLAHHGCSQCKVVIMKGGDGDGESVEESCVWLQVVFVFGHELCLCFVFVFGYKFRLRPVRPVFCWSSQDLQIITEGVWMLDIHCPKISERDSKICVLGGVLRSSSVWFLDLDQVQPQPQLVQTAPSIPFNQFKQVLHEAGLNQSQPVGYSVSTDFTVEIYLFQNITMYTK
jgi:hypothetical protein